MNPTTIQTAAREYANRPTDERFPTVAAMVENAQQQRQHSIEKTINAKDLTAVDVEGALALQGPKGNPARFTHWSFGQLARSIGAPAAYLRGLPAGLAADCVNHGLQHTPPASDFNLLLQAPNGKPYPTVRACTSETYGRVWDAELYGAIQRQIMQHDHRWTTPPTWSGEPAGAYRGDRDSFLILVNGGSIVQDPSLRNTLYRPASTPSTPGTPGTTTANENNVDPSGMYRGLLIRNSEVGAASIVIEQILFRFVCGNHMLWGAIMDKSFSRRHVGAKTLRDTLREISSIAFHWTNSSAGRDEAIIKSLIDHEIAKTKDAVVDELRKVGFSKADAIAAYETCERTEAASPRSFWGLAQGATRMSQQSGYQDDRFQLDQLAAKVLQKGVKQYAMA